MPSEVPFVSEDPLVVRNARGIRQQELREFIAEVARTVLRGRAFACLISDDAEIRRLNRTFRKKNAATDVLSFPAQAPPLPGGRIPAGDIAISLDRARAQAAEHGHSVTNELRILILHGALHLRGMDHETDSGEMARAEVRWRKRLELPVGVLERNQ